MSNCAWPKCHTLIPREMFMCKSHWFALPKELRDRIWKAYRADDRDALLTEHKAALKWISEHDAKGVENPPALPKVAYCSGCDAPIIWFKTAAGKNMPVDAGSVTPGDTEYEHGKHKPHWASCPKAGSFRRNA